MWVWQIVSVLFLGRMAVHLVLLLQLLLHVFEALLDFPFDLALGRIFQVQLVEECSMFIANEVQHFTLGK